MDRTITPGVPTVDISVDGVRNTVRIWMCLLLTLWFCVTPPAAAATPEFKALVAARAAVPHPSHLDLRPPTAAELASLKAAAADSRRGQLEAEDDIADARRHLFPAFAAAATQPTVVARAEALAQRFRHEGLPVARLWESHAAFVSVGLSPRGKPGIWLVQQTH